MNSKNCLVIFNNSWGEVDFILPILKNLHDKNYNIYSSFKSQNFFEKKFFYLDIFKILKKISKILPLNKPQKKNGFYKIILSYLTRPKFLIIKIKNLNFSRLKNSYKNIKVQNTQYHINVLRKKKIHFSYILCADFDSDYYHWIKEYPDSKFLLFPHAITLRGNELNKYRNVSKKVFTESFSNRKYLLNKFPKNSVLFSGDKDELNYFNSFTPKNIKLKILGYPRLSKDWIKFLHKSILNKNLSNNNKRKILLVIGKVNYLGLDEIDKKIRSVIKVAEEHDFDIIFKNHPRNFINLKKYFKYSKKISMKESKYSISGTLKFCDFVILTSKTGVSLECVFQKKIVIEYYSAGNENIKNKVYEYKINNKLQSIYSYLKLTYLCTSHKELKNFFLKIKKNKKFKYQILRRQTNVLFKRIKLNNLNNKITQIIK